MRRFETLSSLALHTQVLPQTVERRFKRAKVRPDGKTTAGASLFDVARRRELARIARGQPEESINETPSRCSPSSIVTSDVSAVAP